MPRFQEEKQWAVRTLIRLADYLIIFGRFFRELSLRAESNPGGAIFLSLYLVLVYLKLLSELALALLLQRKKLPDVIASDH